MKQEKLTEGCKSILIALSGNKYKSSVPEDDVRDFLFYKKKDWHPNQSYKNQILSL